MSSSHAIIVLSVCCLISNVVSFAPQLLTHHVPSVAINGIISPTTATHSQTALSMAGFGGGASTKKQKKKGGAKVAKLKAKSQWDRYGDLKGCEKITVGVRMIKGDDDDSSNEWMEVGRVRSVDDEYTEVAIAKQRALIAEHSKRLYILQIPANAVLDWGYLDVEGEWVVVDKSKGDDGDIDIDAKKFGFEGISDKASGAYCHYAGGKIADAPDTFHSCIDTS